MKDYKRLTDRVTAEMLRNTEGESWDSDNIEAQCYIRLAELEDKIEIGEIDYVSDKDAEIACLTAEVAELHARLDKAVELPCKVGDTVYCISPPFNDNVDKGEIVCVRATKWMDKYDFCITVKGNQPLIYVEDDAIEPLITYYREDINETLFTDRAEAEKKLAELKGEER